MKPPAPTDELDRPAADSISDAPGRGFGMRRVYDALRREIVEMTLPPGEPLDETRLSERFGLSRTPVREALVRLAADGLVTTLPNRNTIVSTIEFDKLPVYFDALTLMYRVTTRLAAAHRKEADIAILQQHSDRFDEAVANADALAMIGANRDLHVAIAEAGGNPYYTELFTRLLDSGRRILRIYYRTFDDVLPRQYANEHAQMIAAIAARDEELADRLATTHAAQIVRQIQSFLDANLGARLLLGPGAPARTSAARKPRA